MPAPLDLEPTPLDLVPTPLDQALAQPQSLPLPDSMCWCACCLPSPCTPTHKGGGLRPPPQRGARSLRRRASICGILFSGWVCRGWASSRHTKTLSPAKASFGAGPVPDPAVLLLDPALLAQVVLALHPEDISLVCFGKK